MAGIKISVLPTVASALTTDFFPVVQGGVTSQETLLQVQTLFGYSSGILSPANGGTGVNNGASTITIGGNLAFSGAHTFVGTLTGNTTVTFPTSGTLATTSSASGTVNSGLINQLTYYSASGTTVSGLPTANNGTLITSAGGVPSISSTLPSAVQTNITALGVQSQALNMGTNGINNVTDPVNAQDAATKNYVDNIATGAAQPCIAASTAALTVTYSNGTAGVGATLTNAGTQLTFALDGQSPIVGQRVLIKNQSSTFQNGIYTVTNVGSGSTNWILTRATDYDTVSDINNTGIIPVSTGTVNSGSGWYNTTTMVTIGTTAITYVQFGTTNAANSPVNTNITSMTGLTGKIEAPTAIASSTGLDVLSFGYTASSVNYIDITNAPTGNSPLISAKGTDAFISMAFSSVGGNFSFQDATNTYGAALKLNNAAGTNYTLLAVTPAQATSQTFFMPASDGAARSVMITNGFASWSFSTAPTLSAITDTNNANLLTFITTASAVNYCTIVNAATGGAVILVAQGSDTNIPINIAGKGTGDVRILGTGTNNNAPAGYVGEFMSASNLASAPITFTSATPKTLQTITLTAGDWDVWGNIFCSGTTITTCQAGLNTTTNTIPDNSLTQIIEALSTGSVLGCIAPMQRFSVSGNTPIYLVATVNGTGTISCSGGIYARRRR